LVEGVTTKIPNGGTHKKTRNILFKGKNVQKRGENSSIRQESVRWSGALDNYEKRLEKGGENPFNGGGTF